MRTLFLTFLLSLFIPAFLFAAKPVDIKKIPTNSILTIPVNGVLPAGKTKLELFRISKQSPQTNRNDNENYNESYWICSLQTNSSFNNERSVAGTLKVFIDSARSNIDWGEAKEEKRDEYDVLKYLSSYYGVTGSYTIQPIRMLLNNNPLESARNIFCEAWQDKDSGPQRRIHLAYRISLYHGPYDRIAEKYNDDSDQSNYHMMISIDELSSAVRSIGGNLSVSIESLK